MMLIQGSKACRLSAWYVQNMSSYMTFVM